MGYRVAKKAWRYVQPFWYNTSVWRTDRRTDVKSIAITCFSIADARKNHCAVQIIREGRCSTDSWWVGRTYGKGVPWVQWRSQEGTRGGGQLPAPQTVILPTKQFHLKNFLTNVPQNVTIYHNWGYKPKTFSARFACNMVLYPNFHSSGAVSDCNVSWVWWLVTVAP